VIESAVRELRALWPANCDDCASQRAKKSPQRRMKFLWQQSANLVCRSTYWFGAAFRTFPCAVRIWNTWSYATIAKRYENTAAREMKHFVANFVLHLLKYQAAALGKT
jgi:hypothetical protein